MSRHTPYQRRRDDFYCLNGSVRIVTASFTAHARREIKNILNAVTALKK